MDDAADAKVFNNSKICVSVDKCYDCEFAYAREEIRSRLEFNRRLLQFQVTIIGTVLAVLIALPKISSLANSYTEMAWALLLWVSVAFSHENGSNNIHIAIAAKFMSRVLNAKYRSESALPVYEWEMFLSMDRKFSGSRLKKYLFVLDGSFIVNSILLFTAAYGFWISELADNFTFHPLASFVFASGLLLAITVIFMNFKSALPWLQTVTSDELEAFKTRYNL